MLSISSSFAISAPADDYAKTKYPIVIVGGAIINFDKFLFIDYFWNIEQTLEKAGAEVFVTTVSASHNNEVRGEQLARLVEDIMSLTQSDKVNLVTISMGGPTGRYVASVYPEMIASISTIDGGHQGIPIADWIVAGEELPMGLSFMLYRLGNFGLTIAGWVLGDGELPVDTAAMAYSESTAGSQEYNALYPEGAPTSECGDGPEVVNGVRYYSMAGAKPFTNFFDPSDYVLYALHKVFYKNGDTSDGVIGSCSSHWGKVIGDDYPMNHMDIANQLFGITQRGFDPVQLYMQQANRLKNLGL